MSLIVTTSLPLLAKSSVVTDDSLNFSKIVERIADELDDTTNEYSSQIQEAVFSAIRFCRRQPFFFNEARDIAFHTSQGEVFYHSTLIDNLVDITAIFAAANGKDKHQLKRISPALFEQYLTAQAYGRPRYFTYFDKSLGFFPIPDQSYDIQVLASLIKDSDLDIQSLDFQWFSYAFDLIKARAKYEIYKDILKDAQMAAASFNDFSEQLNILFEETSRRSSDGYISATRF